VRPPDLAPADPRRPVARHRQAREGAAAVAGGGRGRGGRPADRGAQRARPRALRRAAGDPARDVRGADAPAVATRTRGGADDLKGILVLEYGTAYQGDAIGRHGMAFGEIVFNTAMSGYQEVLTDPSYSGQIVVMTAAHVGNYGIRSDEAESDRVHVSGFLARDFPDRWSGSDGEKSLAEYLDENGILGLHGLDTRALVRRIRSEGAMRAGISSEIRDANELLRRVLESPPMVGADLALSVSPRESRVEAGKGRKKYRVAAIDYGMKRNIVRLLQAGSCRVTVFPATATDSEILASEPDGIFLSNGPGDPAALPGPIRTIEKLIDTDLPIFGIC